MLISSVVKYVWYVQIMWPIRYYIHSQQTATPVWVSEWGPLNGCDGLKWQTWSRLDRLLGSWLRPWYCPLRRSPAAIFLNFFRSTTYKALKQQCKSTYPQPPPWDVAGRSSNVELGILTKCLSHTAPKQKYWNINRIQIVIISKRVHDFVIKSHHWSDLFEELYQCYM